MIGVRREIEFSTFGVYDWPSVGGGTTSFGVDVCEATINGTLVASHDPKTIAWSVKQLRKELAARGRIEDGGGTRDEVEKTIDECNRSKRGA